MTELKIVTEKKEKAKAETQHPPEQNGLGLKRIYKLLLGVIVFSVFLRIALININKAFAWDEIVYISMAKSLSAGLGYGFVGGFTDGFRAPGLTYLIYGLNFVLGNPELAGRVAVLLASIGSIALAYIAGKEWFNRRVGILSALVAATNMLHVFFSHRVLTENLFGFFVLLEVLLFWKILCGNKKPLWALGPIFAFSAMVRYETVVVLFVLLVYALLFRRREFKKIVNTKEFLGSIALFLAVLTPWFVFSQKNFGNPFGAAIHHVTGTVPGFVNPVVLPLMYPLAFGLLLPFFFYALYRTLEYHGEKPLFMFFFLLATLFLIGLKNNVLRYTAAFIPLGAVFVSAAAFHLQKKWKSVFILLCLGNLLIGYGAVYAFNQTEIENNFLYGLIQGRDDNFREHLDFKEAGLKLKELTGENETVMTDAYAFVHYWAERPYILIPPDNQLNEVIAENNIKYIYSTQHQESLRKFTPVFETQNVVIYQVRQG